MLHITAYFQLVPNFFSIFILRHIAQVAVLIGHPAAIHAKGVFVPVSFERIPPFLDITIFDSDTRLGIEKVDADGYLRIIDDDGERVTILDNIELRTTQTNLVGNHLQVPTNDRRGTDIT